MPTVVFTVAYTLHAGHDKANTHFSCVCGVSVTRAHHRAPVRSLFWLQELLRFSPGLVPASSPLKCAVLEDAVSASSSLRADE